MGECKSDIDAAGRTRDQHRHREAVQTQKTVTVDFDPAAAFFTPKRTQEKTD